MSDQWKYGSNGVRSELVLNMLLSTRNGVLKDEF
jgi:hypothetical protein